MRATRGVWTALIDIIPGELLCNSVNMREELHNKAASDVSDFPCSSTARQKLAYKSELSLNTKQ